VGTLHREASWPLAGRLPLRPSAPAGALPSSAMCLGLRAISHEISLSESAVKIACREGYFGRLIDKMSMGEARSRTALPFSRTANSHNWRRIPTFQL
jgi:hypothetical protein